ncbi:hypothetical protein [Chroococcus sp. FPU101]|uniref:hypothetical protein n=1 Tax=Chroococcus sp. FPU101 TaxID=1974212 RepID=UPI001A8D162A|nr:hypothetical protein [Chroococcus sp. FPU101]GFE71787.1 hypothetical protein CFPU101_43970 [Chroococcus sp. FPU101]
MKTLIYKPSEQLSNQKAVKQASFWTKLSNIGQNFSQFFNTSLELQVWRMVDQNGNIWWSAYNPKNGQSVKRISEEQMRIWIEQNYR